MYIKQYLEDNSISIYKVANSALVAYPTVFNIVNGRWISLTALSAL